MLGLLDEGACLYLVLRRRDLQSVEVLLQSLFHFIESAEIHFAYIREMVEFAYLFVSEGIVAKVILSFLQDV